MKTQHRSNLVPVLFFGLSLLGATGNSCAGSAESGVAVEPLPALQRIEIGNALTPLPGLLTGGQPSQENLAAAAKAGYRTIIDLRLPAEDRGFDERALVESLGMRYVTLPIDGGNDMTRAQVRQFANVLAEAGKGPTMIHCGSGNRIGALFALKAAWFDGQTPEDALALGLDRGMTRLEPAIRKRLGLPPVVEEPGAGQ